MFDDDPTGPRKSRFWKLRRSAILKPQPWRWPLERRDGHGPIVLARRASFDRQGIEIGYAKGEVDPNAPVYAAQDGHLMFCGETRTGYAISIDHVAYGFATYYGHL